MNFIISNQENLQTDSYIDHINTRKKHSLHRPNVSLYCFPNGAFYAGSKILDILPPSFTILKNEKAKLRVALIKHLHTHLILYMNVLYVKMIYNAIHFVK